MSMVYGPGNGLGGLSCSSRCDLKGGHTSVLVPRPAPRLSTESGLPSTINLYKTGT